MGTWKSYTEYEDSVILNMVEEYPHRMNFAFEAATRMLPGRTVDGIRFRWHHTLKHKQPGFVLKSDKTEVVNRKNTPEKRELRGAEYHLNALVEILQAKRDTLDNVISTLKSIEL